MPILVPGKPYELAKAGMHHTVVCDVQDLGIVQTQWKDDRGNLTSRPEVKVTYRLEQKDSQGNPIEISRTYNNTPSRKGNLFPVFWAATRTHLSAGSDLESMIGKLVDVLVVHNVGKDGFTYHNIDKVLPPESEADKQSQERVARVTAAVKQAAQEHGARVRANGKGNTPDPARFNPKDLKVGDGGILA